MTIAATRIRHLDRIAAELEEKILAGRGDLEAMRQEWRACQDEMRAIERHGWCPEHNRPCPWFCEMDCFLRDSEWVEPDQEPGA